MTTDATGKVETNSGGSLGGRRICIVGAGIGGLTAALAFARRGAQVEVLEKAPVIAEVGAGIQITPNGMRVLLALGLSQARIDAASLVAQAVVPTDALVGQAITRFDLSGQSPAYRFFHRAALIALIGDAARQAGVTIHLGVEVANVQPDGLVNTSHGEFESDLCVGADGIHSTLRPALGNTAKPTFTGQVAWRATIPVGQTGRGGQTPAEAQIWMAPGRHVVTYPLKGDMLNIVAVQERHSWAADGWSHKDDPENLRAAFVDTCDGLRDILGRVQDTYLWGLHRHPVADHWHSDSGHLAILGDAAHPTLPFLAQGANLAIEDAWVLAACCDTDIPKGLVQYQAERSPRVQKAIAAANANARNYHLSGIARRVAHTGLKTLGFVAPNAFLARMDWLYGLDVTQ